MRKTVSKKSWAQLATLFCAIVCDMEATGRAEDNELLKPGTTTAPAVVIVMTQEEMLAAGEHATKAADKLGWRIGVQAWTFNRRSFFQDHRHRAFVGAALHRGVSGAGD